MLKYTLFITLVTLSSCGIFGGEDREVVVKEYFSDKVCRGEIDGDFYSFGRYDSQQSCYFRGDLQYDVTGSQCFVKVTTASGLTYFEFGGNVDTDGECEVNISEDEKYVFGKFESDKVVLAKTINGESSEVDLTCHETSDYNEETEGIECSDPTKNGNILGPRDNIGHFAESYLTGDNAVCNMKYDDVVDDLLFLRFYLLSEAEANEIELTCKEKGGTFSANGNGKFIDFNSVNSAETPSYFCVSEYGESGKALIFAGTSSADIIDIGNICQEFRSLEVPVMSPDEMQAVLDENNSP